MRVLVACEFSGIVREAFNQRGHRATSADLLPTDIPGDHYQGDVLEILDQGWDLMIAHPPCTYLCNSGVRWLYEQPDRMEKMVAARNFFLRFCDADIPRICIENPIPHKYLFSDIFVPRYDQIVQPWMFGHGETKATCLWLKNLPKLQPTNIVSGRNQRIHKMSPGPNRSKERSRTFKGIAAAMADQWGSL